MKITLVQQNHHVGNLQHNEKKIVDAIAVAKNEGADLVVFSELSICGYPPQDLLLFDSFIDECSKAIQRIAKETLGVAVLVGCPMLNKEKSGKRLFNSACFIVDGEIVSYHHKTNLPNYDIFDESRYFEPSHDWNIIQYKGYKIGVVICEDIWDDYAGKHYLPNPLEQLKKLDVNVLINLSASPFDYLHHNKRIEAVKKASQWLNCSVLYCNAVGGQTNILFDGQSMVSNKSGEIIRCLPMFEEGSLQVELDQEANIVSEKNTLFILDSWNVEFTQFQPEVKIAEIHQALVLGVKDYFSKMGFKKAILGSSGGIDSAVVLALAVEALGKENVISLMMPSVYSSDHSVGDAKKLSDKLGNENHLLPINEIHKAFELTLEPHFKNTTVGLAEENIQSRIRGNILMAMANKRGAVLLNTSNKSELATGYGTLYGDMAGGISVIGDCYKQQVYALAKYINRQEEIIPQNIINKAPSAELRPDQKDIDSLPEYETLDAILFQYIEKVKNTSEISKLGFDESLVEKIIRMVNVNEYKRHQFCPILRISPKTLGIGRKMPIVAKYPNY